VCAEKVPGLLYIFFRSLWEGGENGEREERRGLIWVAEWRRGSWLAGFLW
jgi:hypothetical protein